MGKTILTVTVILAAAMIIAAAGCAGAGGPDPLDAVRVESTRQAVRLEATRTVLDLEQQAFDLERERMQAASIDVFWASVRWIGLGVLLGMCAIAVWFTLPILVQRLGLVTRKAEDGESLLLMGKHRIALPLRAAGPYLDLAPGAERAPLLAESAEAQAAATLRQQAGNLAQASQTAETVKARVGGGDVTYLLPPIEKRERERALLAPSPVRVVEPDDVRTGQWLADVEKQELLEAVNDDDD
jgi:hypothetical protein